MKRLTYILVFLISFSFFFYFSFPFEKVVEHELCKRGIVYSSVSVSRIPLKVKVSDVSYRNLNFEEVSISPDLFSFFGKFKKFKASLRVCGGTLNVDASFPLRDLSFQISSITVSRCFQRLPFKLDGQLYGSGKFRFVRKGVDDGNANLKLKSFKVNELSFGILSLRSADLGDGILNVDVGRKNLLKIRLKLSGRDADVFSDGVLRVNEKDVGDSYVNLKFKVKVKKQPFNGKDFNFSLKGRLMELL